MSESQHRRGDAQDRTGVRQTRPSGTRQTRPSGANGTRRPSSSGNPKKRRKRRKKRSVNSRIGKVLLIVAIVIAFAVAGAILGTVFGILQSTDMLNTSDVLPDSYTSVIYDADDNEVDKLHGERGATSQHRSCSQGLKFQSALPRGERLASQCMIIGAVCISIRAPARGATQSIPIILCNRNNFNPRSREGSDSHSIATNDIFHISIRAPARGATLYYVALFIYILISIRAPARGAT